MTPETIAEKEKTQYREGEILSDGTIKPGPFKFSGFPWFLASWYQENAENEQEGRCEDIGHHACFDVGDETRKEYAPDIPENVVGYIVREDSAGFMSFESYETQEAYATAWHSVQDAMEKFHTCETCKHVNYDNGSGCEGQEDQDEPCTCQECGDNPKQYRIFWQQPRITYVYARNAEEAHSLFEETDISALSELEMEGEDRITSIEEVED